VKKKKILLLSDHALCTSGVGTQSRHLIEGLLNSYPGEWSFRQFGAAVKHANYDTIAVNEDFIIKPIDGFGDRDMLRIALATEKPDILMLFTDPRFFIWLFEMEDEIHQTCPIVWWHVWDNRPAPRYNDVLYESTDLINCHSYLTYEMCSENFPEKTNFIPHALPDRIFYAFNDEEKLKHKKSLFGKDKIDHFFVLWVNRNARRKRPNDVLESWKIFLDSIDEKYGHRNAHLLMHTEPTDDEGPNLYVVAEYLGIKENVIFSTERIDFEQMNVLHNVTDCCLNIAYAEGFGLPTLEAMQTGNPVIALKTGGLTRQVVDHRNGTEYGVALPVELKSLVGSQLVPYIYEDYVSNQTVANALLKIFELGDSGRKTLGQQARDYVLSEFSYQNTVDMWHNALKDTYENWRARYPLWEKITL